MLTSNWYEDLSVMIIPHTENDFRERFCILKKFEIETRWHKN